MVQLSAVEGIGNKTREFRLRVGGLGGERWACKEVRYEPRAQLSDVFVAIKRVRCCRLGLMLFGGVRKRKSDREVGEKTHWRYRICRLSRSIKRDLLENVAMMGKRLLRMYCGH